MIKINVNSYKANNYEKTTGDLKIFLWKYWKYDEVKISIHKKGYEVASFLVKIKTTDICKKHYLTVEEFNAIGVGLGVKLIDGDKEE